MTRSREDGTSIRPIPAELDSPAAKLVYLCLDTDGPRTVDELQRRTGLTKLRLHGVLGHLERGRLVRREDGEYVVAE